MPDLYPPGPPDQVLQIAVSTLRQLHDRLGFLIEMAQTYGEIVHFRTGPRHIYLLNKPDYIHTVLVEQAAKFYKTKPFKDILGKFLGNGLLVNDGESHTRQRRLAQPAFHHKRIDAYADIMVECTKQITQGWRSGEMVQIDQEMMRITLGIVAKTLFNADVSTAAQTVSESMAILQDGVTKQFQSLVRLPPWVPTSRNRREQAALRAMDEIIYQIIDERKGAPTDTGDLLSMLLLAEDVDGQRMNITQLRDEAMSLFVAGHETTGNSLMWTWYLLSQHPEATAKLTEELDRVLGGRKPTAQDVSRLPYTSMIFKEALRLYPPAWVITRQAIEDVSVGPYTLRAGSVVVISPYVTHRNPAYFSEPECFLPERFSESDERRLPRFAYFPFGGGPHVCIGQGFAMLEAILILATIAQDYQFALVPLQQIEIEPLVTLRAKNGIRMTLTRRV